MAVERAVFDTNVWISGLLWRGKPYQCLILARSGAVQLIYCAAILDELLDKLRYSFGFSEEDLRTIKSEFAEIGQSVDIGGALRAVPADPDDDKFVGCALAGNVSVLVSGDKHLLELGTYQGVRMISPAEFLRLFGEK
jgi:putative PIN family toxin of toxin-antitoxin system